MSSMGADQESFSGRAVFEVIDSSGRLLFSDNLQTRGVRQHAVCYLGIGRLIIVH